MTRYVAFLRGVNLGKRTVRSAELKAAFEAMGFAEVKTLLASGNVLFDAASARGLRQKIEAGLAAAFGFPRLAARRGRDRAGSGVNSAFRAAVIAKGFTSSAAIR